MGNYIQIPSDKIGMAGDFDYAINCHYVQEYIVTRPSSHLKYRELSGINIIELNYLDGYIYYDLNKNAIILLPACPYPIFEGMAWHWGTKIIEARPTSTLGSQLDGNGIYGYLLSDYILEGQLRYCQLLTNLYIKDNHSLYVYRRGTSDPVGTLDEITAQKGVFKSGWNYLKEIPQAEIITKFGNSLVFANFNPDDEIPFWYPVDKDSDVLPHDILKQYDLDTETYGAVSLNSNMFLWTEPLGIIGGLNDPNALAFPIAYSARINSNEPITGCKEYKGNLFIFTENEIHVAQIRPSLDEFRQEVVTKEIGCISQDSIQDIGNELIFLSKDGFYSISSEGFKKKSPPTIDRIFSSIHSKPIISDVWNNFIQSYEEQNGINNFRLNPNQYSRIRSIIKTDDREYICQIPIHGNNKIKTIWIVYNYKIDQWYVWLSIPNLTNKYRDGTTVIDGDLESLNMMYEKNTGKIFFVYQNRGLFIMPAQVKTGKQIPVLIQSRELFSEQDNEVVVESMKMKHLSLRNGNYEFEGNYNLLDNLNPISYIESEGAYLEKDYADKDALRINKNEIPLHLYPDKHYFWGYGIWGETIWKNEDLITHDMKHNQRAKWLRIGIVSPIGLDLIIKNISIEIKAESKYGEIGKQNVS